MRWRTNYFEIQDMVIQFANAFDSIVIGRYNKNRKQKDRIFVRYLYAPKQRVLYDIVNKAKTITLPVVTVNIANIARDNNKIHGELNGNLSLKLALSFIYILLLFSVGIIFSYNWYEIKWLIVIGFNQILVALILFMRSNLSALFLLKEDSFISVLDRIILILFCGYFLWAGTTNTLITIEFFILSQTLAYTLTLIICIAILKNKIREFKLHWNIPFFKSSGNCLLLLILF